MSHGGDWFAAEKITFTFIKKWTNFDLAIPMQLEKGEWILRWAVAEMEKQSADACQLTSQLAADNWAELTWVTVGLVTVLDKDELHFFFWPSAK